MRSNRFATGAKAFLQSIGELELTKGQRLLFIMVANAGWFLLLFVVVIYLLFPRDSTASTWVLRWLSVFLVYLILLEILCRVSPVFYEGYLFRMVRTQTMIFMASVLMMWTGGSESDFWFIYLWPLFSSALYFSWMMTFAIYAEAAVLYASVSIIVADRLALVNIPTLVTILAVMLVLTVVPRYLVETVRKYQAIERKLSHSTILQVIQQDIDTAVDLKEVLTRILRWAVELVGATDGSLMLIEEDGELHVGARTRGRFPADEGERTFTVGTPDEGIAGFVARTGKAYVSLDTSYDERFVGTTGDYSVRSLVSVPIISHGTVLGVINVDSPEPHRFSTADAELLSTLANQVARAIERAELWESLQRISEKTISGAEDLHEDIVNAVHRLTRDPVAMWQVDETGKQVRIVASQGIRSEHVQNAVADLDYTVTGRAIRRQEIIQVVDLQADPHFRNKAEAAREGWQSMLTVPLLVGPEKAVGTLSIYSTTKREGFTRWELDLLRTFGGQAGVAIRNASLVNELTVLSEIGRSVSVLGIEAIANLVYQKTSQLMDVTNFFLGLYDEEKETLDIKAWIFDGQTLEPFSTEVDGLAGWVVHEKRPLLIRDWDKEERAFPVKAIIITKRQRSWLGVPLLIGEKVLGVMGVQSSQPYAFDLHTQQTLEIVSVKLKRGRNGNLKCPIYGRISSPFMGTRMPHFWEVKTPHRSLPSVCIQ